MAEQPRSERSVQHDMPAQPDVETREETVARVTDETEAASAGHGGSPDPSTRRGVQRTLGVTLLVAGATGAVAGAVLGTALSFWPGPRDEGRGLGIQGEGVWHTVSYAAVMAIALAIVFAAVAAFLTLAREDGRIEREVEERTGRGPEGPGKPSEPGHDLKPR